MTWLEHAENPDAVASIFGSPPSLQNVEIFAVKVDRDGPTVELEIALSDFPSSPPLRWRTSNANAVIMTLQLFALETFEMRGWSTSNTAEIRIARKNQAQLEMVAEGGDLKMRATFGFLRIVGFSPYRLSGPLTRH